MDVKKKVILFGASDSGKDVYERLKNQYIIIGFFDNDKRKQNKEFCGVPVISPAPIENINVDAVVICSHQWKDIYQQLTNDLKISEEMIRVGPSLLKKTDIDNDVKILEVCETTKEINKKEDFGIYWLMAYSCNYQCSYCFYKMKEKTTTKISEDHINNAIENIASLKNKTIKIDLVGGEPTLFPHYEKLVLSLEKLPNVNIIQTETNLSKNLDYFEDLFKKITNKNKLAFIASYHSEFAKQEDFINKILLFNKYNIAIDVVFMAHPQKLEKIKRIMDIFATYQLKSVKFQVATVLDMGIPDARYKESELEWIKTINDRFGDKYSISDKSVCIKYEIKGKINEINISPRRAIVEGFNDFKNMQCMAGIESIRVNEKGDIFPAMCFWDGINNIGYINEGKNILNKNEKIVYDNPVICPTSCCLVPSDLQISKKR